MKTFTESHNVSDSFEKRTVKIRFIYRKHWKAEQTYFQILWRWTLLVLKTMDKGIGLGFSNSV